MDSQPVPTNRSGKSQHVSTTSASHTQIEFNGAGKPLVYSCSQSGRATYWTKCMKKIKRSLESTEPPEKKAGLNYFHFGNSSNRSSCPLVGTTENGVWNQFMQDVIPASVFATSCESGNHRSLSDLVKIKNPRESIGERNYVQKQDRKPFQVHRRCRRLH